MKGQGHRAVSDVEYSAKADRHHRRVAAEHRVVVILRSSGAEVEAFQIDELDVKGGAGLPA